LVLFNLAGAAYKFDEMKATRKRAYKLSALLEAELVLVIVVGYALILLSQSQALF
jgi:hypothetical protein